MTNTEKFSIDDVTEEFCPCGSVLTLTHDNWCCHHCGHVEPSNLDDDAALDRWLWQRA